MALQVIVEQCFYFVAIMATMQTTTRKLKEGEVRKQLVKSSYDFWEANKLTQPACIAELADRFAE